MGVKMAEIDVIIPTYQGKTRGFVVRAIQSVLDQTMAAHRVIVVDDGSNDGTAEMIQAAFPGGKVEVHSISNSGPSSARNYGLREATGSFVALLDDDDVWLPHKLDTQMRALKQNPDWIGCFTSMQIIDEHDVVSRRISQPVPVLTWPEILLGNGSAPSTLIFKRSVIQKGLLFYDREVGEDTEFFIDLTRFGAVGVLSEVLVGYRKYGGNRSAKLKAWDRQLVDLIEKHCTELSDQARARTLNFYLFSHCIRWMIRGDYKEARRFWQMRRRTYHWPVDFLWRLIVIGLARFPTLQVHVGRLEFNRLRKIYGNRY